MTDARIRIAHLGFYDAAPLLAAESCGCFAAENLHVQIVRELGMASIASGLSESRLAGAIIPAQAPLLLRLGVGRACTETRALAETSAQGMAIVLSTRLPAGSPALPKSIGMPALKLGVISPESPGKLLINRWWRSISAEGGREPVCIPVAATQLVDFMLDGVIDGFCGPDPLGLVVQLTGVGRVIINSANLQPGHPGSVLVVTDEFLRHEPHACQALARAVARGRERCADLAKQQRLLGPMLADLMPADAGTDIQAALAGLVQTPGYAKPSITFAVHDRGARPDAAGLEFISQAIRTEMSTGARNREFSAEILGLYHPATTVEGVTFPQAGRETAHDGRKSAARI